MARSGAAAGSGELTTIVLVGTLDTKGEEYRYARDRLRALGAETLVVDTGILGDPAFRPDITSAEVAAAAGVPLERLRTGHDRGAAVAAMARGASVVLGGLRARPASTACSRWVARGTPPLPRRHAGSFPSASRS